MSKQIKNQVKLGVFCALIGGFIGIIIWAFLKIMSEGIFFLWEWIPKQVEIPFYTVIVCVVGAVLIGLIRKKYGDYPEEMDVVIEKVKTEKRYEYKNMLVMLVVALLSLLIGSSVGPEAGLVGIIVGLCYWAGDNLKFAHQHAKACTGIGMEVTLSMLFHAPLFGIFAVEENAEVDTEKRLDTSSKVFLYGVALAAATAVIMLLNKLFGAGMEGFPSFDSVEPTMQDYFMIVVYVIVGCLLAKFYELTHKGCHILAGKIPPILREVVAGLCLGIVGTFVPMIMFSGEEEMGALMTEYVEYIPWMLVGVAFLKVLITNVCVQSGLKGGHFFPVIFAGVALGYGVAMLVFPDPAAHVAFGAAMVTAATLGGTMKKPLAVTMLLFLCFPVKLFVWIFLAALVGSKCFSHDEK